MRAALLMQVLADMIISNESRIVKSKMIASYDQPRQYITQLNVRLQVYIQAWPQMLPSAALSDGEGCWAGVSCRLLDRYCVLSVIHCSASVAANVPSMWRAAPCRRCNCYLPFVQLAMPSWVKQSESGQQIFTRTMARVVCDRMLTSCPRL